MIRKTYVAVTARFAEDGAITPLSVIWRDGREFIIDRVLGQERIASIRAGGIGIRYHIRVNGKETYLWHEQPAWFVEEEIRN